MFYHDCSNARKTTTKNFFLLIYVFWLTNENLILTIEGSRGWKFWNIKVCPKEKFHFNFLIFFIFRLVVYTHYKSFVQCLSQLCVTATGRGDVSPLRQDCRIVAAARTRRHGDVTAAILDMRHRIGRLEGTLCSPHTLASTHTYTYIYIQGERERLKRHYGVN